MGQEWGGTGGRGGEGGGVGGKEARQGEEGWSPDSGWPSCHGYVVLYVLNLLKRLMMRRRWRWVRSGRR